MEVKYNMFPLARMEQNQILLVIANHAAREQMLEWIAMQACQGRVRVVDGSNQFNVYQVAKTIRRQTARLTDALKNIQISRSFSCYQMTAMLEKILARPGEPGMPEAGMPAENIPVFVLDLLFSYYDEDIKLPESQRLLKKSIRALEQLSRRAPVVISSRPMMYNQERKMLLDELKETATLVWEAEETVTRQLPAPNLLPWPEEKSS